MDKIWYAEYNVSLSPSWTQPTGHKNNNHDDANARANGLYVHKRV